MNVKKTNRQLASLRPFCHAGPPGDKSTGLNEQRPVNGAGNARPSVKPGSPGATLVARTLHVRAGWRGGEYGWITGVNS